jgi:hypothetical protein
MPPMVPDMGGQVTRNAGEAWMNSAAASVSLGRIGLSVGVGFVPVAGAIQSIVELASGRDYITGEETSRVLAAVGIAAGLVGLKGFLKGATKADDIAEGIADVASRLCCFVAGTLVMTDSGLRPIEEIEVGDRVLSRHEATGETAFKSVTELIRRYDREVWELKLHVKDDSGTPELFETTGDHPWRTTDNLWISTADLTPGTHIERANGVPAVVIAVQNTGRTAPTFNLEVSDFHSYFVGETGAWVHNENCLLAARQALITALRARVDSVRDAGRAAQAVGAARESRVAQLIGGAVSRQKITVAPFGSTDLDVIGKAGELVSVGGIAKAGNLGRFGRELQILLGEAARRGVGVKVALEQGSPQSLIDFASKRVGKENVIIFE